MVGAENVHSSTGHLVAPVESVILGVGGQCASIWEFKSPPIGRYRGGARGRVGRRGCPRRRRQRVWARGFKLRPAQAGDFGPDNRSLAHKSLEKKRQNVLVALVKFSTPQGKI